MSGEKNVDRSGGGGLTFIWVRRCLSDALSEKPDRKRTNHSSQKQKASPFGSDNPYKIKLPYKKSLPFLKVFRKINKAFNVCGNVEMKFPCTIRCRGCGQRHYNDP